MTPQWIRYWFEAWTTMTFRAAKAQAAVSSCLHRPSPPSPLRWSLAQRLPVRRSAALPLSALATGTSARAAQSFDPDLRKMLDEIDPQRIQTTITTLAR